MKEAQYPSPVLRAGVIYHSDNGRLICLECAGASALYTGFDLSGQRVTPVPVHETVRWKKEFGRDMTCECGQTRYLQPIRTAGSFDGR
jgi:hypothetical protein